MNRLIGKRKQELRPTLSDAIQNIESRGENVDKKIAKLDSELKKLRDQMERMRDGPSKELVKQKALRILKQKRMYEGQQDQLHQQIFNMDQTNFAIMGMKDNQVTYAAMKDGLKAMATEYKKLDLTKIEKLQDDMEDMLEMNNEINGAFSRCYETPDVDESELDAELAALSEELDIGMTDMSYMDEALAAPTVPDGVPKKFSMNNAVEVDEFGLPKVPMLN